MQSAALQCSLGTAGAATKRQGRSASRPHQTGAAVWRCSISPPPSMHHEQMWAGLTMPSQRAGHAVHSCRVCPGQRLPGGGQVWLPRSPPQLQRPAGQRGGCAPVLRVHEHLGAGHGAQGQPPAATALLPEGALINHIPRSPSHVTERTVMFLPNRQPKTFCCIQFIDGGLLGKTQALQYVPHAMFEGAARRLLERSKTLCMEECAEYQV